MADPDRVFRNMRLDRRHRRGRLEQRAENRRLDAFNPRIGIDHTVLEHLKPAQRLTELFARL
jgi:hypothetical protein